MNMRRRKKSQKAPKCILQPLIFLLSPFLFSKVLPWKRDPNPDSCLAPMKQREFPSWLKNENYMVHGSPVDVVDNSSSGGNGEGSSQLAEFVTPLFLEVSLSLQLINRHQVLL